MADDPTAPGDAPPGTVDSERIAHVVLANRAAPSSSAVADGDVGPIPLLAETVRVTKRRRPTGRVRVGTHTETVQAIAEVELDRYRVEVTRVPVGRVVAEAPSARTEGDTTVIPVVEERLVVVKQLVLVEELHVRHVLERETVTEAVTLRRQHAVVERLGDQGEPTSAHATDDDPQADPRRRHPTG